ncbi:hypothetical protein Fmac_003399 [Flemingia macrophylla]|uniref:Uncharacterized protein n=1 Tax=Flemingia macrophylla TaxID=520843 RepID=A0ABD1NMN8_9FABA
MAEAQSDKEDPYAFLVDLACISPSQEQLLRHAPVVTYNHQHAPPYDDDQRRTTTVTVDKSAVDVGAPVVALGDICDNEKELSHLGESRMEKSKLSEHGLGSGPSGVEEGEGGALSLSKRCRLEDVASQSECVGSGEKKEFSVFDVLRALSQQVESGEVEDNRSLWEVAEACGLTFPRPRWWPEDFNPKD